MTEIQLAIHSYSLVQHFLHKPGFTVFDFIDMAVERGFTGVNINLNRPDYRHLTGQSAQHIARVRAYIEARGLDLEIDTSGTAPVHLKTLLTVARDLGARNLRTYTRHKGGAAEVAGKTAADLKEAVRHAEALGIPIVLENHEEFTGPELAAVVEEVGSPWLKVLYDYGNSQMVLEDPIEALEALLPHVLTVHLKDHVMLAPEDSPDGRLSVLGVAIGEGNLPILEITQRLVARGLTRIVFENVWAYRAPVRRLEPGRGVKLGAGAFAFARPPFDPVRCLPDAARMTSENPGRLVELELAALDRGLAWLRKAFSGAGFAFRAP